jgi:hypothetical protein
VKLLQTLSRKKKKKKGTLENLLNEYVQKSGHGGEEL